MKQLYTPWGETLDKTKVLSEYPRPQLRRDSYLNLNGLWDYCITKEKHKTQMDGTILVPFSPESVLSGVHKTVAPNEYLIYTKNVELPKEFIKKYVILHFGAVDQEAEIYINDEFVFSHIGGFTPFSVDITNHITSTQFKLKVIVRDVTDTGIHQTGKQRLKRGGIFYTPQSGIWQTVWLESVPKNYVKDIRIMPYYDQSKVGIEITPNTVEGSQTYKYTLSLHGTVLIEGISVESNMLITIPNMNSWTPENPTLYDLEMTYDQDVIKTYFGMRKFERKTDSSGTMRFYLNNQPYFLSGVLDQGYYPDGLLTNPDDKALIYDIKTMKEMGFNLLRKHIKIEPLRWYYHCDRLGMIVWQDMINGSERKDIVFHGALALMNIHMNDKRYRFFGRKHEVGRRQYMIELDEMLHHLKNITCISTWVPFNEAWGQFDALKVTKHIQEFDSTRLIDHASGWSDQGGGDFSSKHIYFKKIKFSEKQAKKRILALTEFGGYSLLEEGHCFNPDKVFGYKKFKTKAELEQAIVRLYKNEVFSEIDKGLHVLVYTQLSDVEDEVNGLLTYDRRICKINKAAMYAINKVLYKQFNLKTKNS